MNTTHTLICIAILAIGCFAQPPEKIQVTNFPDQINEIYHGWFSCNESTLNYLYYQLYSADNTQIDSSPDVPVILYLEGGPMDPSSITAFAAIGPYGVEPQFDILHPILSEINFTIFRRDLAWTNKYHLLAIDQPVYSGYSTSLFYPDPSSYVNNTDQSTDQLMIFLANFYNTYTELAKNPLYIVGRSYGGHWAPALTARLVETGYKVNDTIQLNVKGMIIADGLMNPGAQSEWADYIYTGGVTDRHYRDLQQGYDTAAKEAFIELDGLNTGIDFLKVQNFLTLNSTPQVYVNNYREYIISLQKPSPVSVLKTIGAPQIFFALQWNNITDAITAMDLPQGYLYRMGDQQGFLNILNSGDFGRDMDPDIVRVLNAGLTTCFFVGQDDLNLNPPSMLNFLNTLSWDGIPSFRKAKRNLWKDENGYVLGASKKHENLIFVNVNKAGHLATEDVPASVYDLIQRTIEGTW